MTRRRAFKSLLAAGSSLLAVGCSFAMARADVPVSYSLAESGRVSVAVYDLGGRQVRTLLSGAKQEAGPHALSWDGLDWTGRPVSPGSYEWRLLESQGLKSEFRLRLGTSVNYDEWPCNHDGPQCVTVDGATAVLSGGGECVPHGARVSLTNDAFLGQARSFDRGTVIAGGKLLSLRDCTLYVSDQKTGAKLANRNLLHYAKRLDFQAPDARLEAEWQEVPLVVYSKERGFGWDSVDGLKAATDAPGSRETLRDFHGPDSKGLAAELGGDPHALFVFRVDVPKGHYTVNLLMGTKTEPFEVELYSGLKDGRPAFLRTEKFEEAVTGKREGNKPATLARTITFEAATTGNQLVLGFKSPKESKTYWTLRGLTILAKPERFSVNGPHLVVGYPANGTVRWLDAADKNLKDLGTAAVEGLRDLAALPDGRVVVATATQLVEVSRGQPPAVKATGVINGQFISVDASNGDILVAGGWSGPVLRFDRTYQLKATYGRVGGRQQGLYNPEDFCAIHDFASDNRGGFLVVENWSAPRRLAHFGPDGKLLKEWCGGQLFFTGSWADPADPRRVWMNSHWGWIMEVEADYEARTWKTRSTYCLTGLGDGLVPMGGLINTWAVRHHGGHRYLVRPGSMPCVLLVDEENHRLLPMVVSGDSDDQINHSKVVSTLLAEVNKNRPKEKGRYGAFFWQDANGDGLPQEDEVRLSLLRGWGGWSGGCSVDEDLTFTLRRSDKDGILVYRLPVKEWIGVRPVYACWDDITPVRIPSTTPELAKARMSWSGGGSVGPDGGVYQQIQGKGEGFIAGYWTSPAHSGTWPNNMIGESALCKWLPNGGLAWRVGRLNTGWQPTEPGTMNSPAAILGFAHGCVLFSSRILQPMEAWTEDGLYAGAVFDRRADDGLPGAYYAWWRGPGGKDGKAIASPIQYDMFSGGSMTVQTNGDVLFFGTGWNNVLAYRVTGWDTFQRQSGHVELKEQVRPPSGTGKGLYGEFFTDEAMTGKPVRRRITPLFWIGGKYWPKTADGKEAACARWTGFIEARYSEDYRLKAYVDQGQDIMVGGVKKRMPNDRVRIWVADRLVMDGWTNTGGAHVTSGPVALKAGEKTPIRMEYAKTTTRGSLNFCWESRSQEIQHVPAACLYPPDGVTTDSEVQPEVAKAAAGPELAVPAGDEEPMPAQLNETMNELQGP